MVELLARLDKRLSDPRRIHPLYIFGGGLTFVIPIWLLFYYS